MRGDDRLDKIKRGWVWLCGLQVSQYSTEKSEEVERKQALISLEEDPNVKKILNICLLILLVVGIFLYTYFSIDPFPNNIDPRKHQVSKLLFLTPANNDTWSKLI